MSAMQATLIETGVHQDVNNMERYLYAKLQTMDPNEPALTYLGVAYRIGVTKSFSYSVSNFMTCDKVNLGLNQTSVTMGFEWRL